ncbi:hypothetical protein BIV57_21680 [Mangrovactinospora gilvigrisea]|uniref:Fe/B12 periplasmic-binding domain-containing protein n=1 Tax=Mangrovactinospora gilvigrisea TaxID=1428644 RepID=A0A1J7B9Y2_9ACTN|nr:ABC transporter substrate-binding protein [Mangrovactinospora gilvigrisea]OIV35405.1 hypothetical protein BIV57_21680 [Mangrovactinospora gilvigrisea]
MTHPLNRRFAGTAAAALAALALLAGCGSSGSGGTSAPAASRSAASGAAAGAPKRIVSLSPTATEDLYAVGAGRQVVAVDSLSDYPKQAPKTSLSAYTPNVEAIAKYRPDLVLAAQDRGGLVSGLKKLGVKTVVLPAADTLPAAYAQVAQVGSLTGHATRGRSVAAAMKTSIDGQLKKAGRDHSDLSAYWETTAKPYYAASSDSLVGRIVAMFGLRNIADKAPGAASSGGYPQLSEEYIVKSRPDVVLLADTGSGGGQTAATVKARAGWSVVPAVAKNRIYPLDADIASRWGPRLPLLVGSIAKAVEQAGK